MERKTLVLIPGLLSDSRVWRPLAAALGSNFELHDADLCSWTSLTGAAQLILDNTRGPLVVVGHSMGGRIALELARLAPERVNGLVLADTGSDPRRDGEQARRQAMIDLGHQSMTELADKWLPPMVDSSRHPDSALMEDLRSMVLQADAELHERQMRALVERPDATGYLHSIRCPVLLLVGENDGWSPPQQHRQMAGRLPDASLSIIPEAGHFAPIERPDDTVSAIRSWLVQNKLV